MDKETKCQSNSLIFPSFMNRFERREAEIILSRLGYRAQLVLDELEGRVKAKLVSNPMAFLRKLALAAEQGTFIPKYAIDVMKERRYRQYREKILKEEEETGVKIKALEMLRKCGGDPKTKEATERMIIEKRMSNFDGFKLAQKYIPDADRRTYEIENGLMHDFFEELMERTGQWI